MLASKEHRPRRLVDTRSLQIVEFTENETIPPYAILSHRWIHWQEVTFQEFKEFREETKTKKGYQKIQQACHQAVLDGLNYIWIDTCCINKHDRHDVARNIRSMYAYYQNARICYAYLVDLNPQYTGFLLMEDFSKSAWFHRGWTLQELLAPREVVFFTRKWKRVGSRDQHKDLISPLTGIPHRILSGQQSIWDVNPLERLSWAVGRKTTRPQDRAYCLQGLLGISIDPDYKETIEESLLRLKLALINVYPELKESFETDDLLRKVVDIRHRIFPLALSYLVEASTRPRRLMNSHTFKIIEFKEHDTIPPYAILSHKWIHGEEITLQDFKQSRNRQVSKKGYHKVRRACGKARQDGIRYIWIDTCCIDQTNPDDIAQNIKSMYAYYQNATVCYAYLDDVRCIGRGRLDLDKSQWFQRGWTLQELVAPEKVIFFNQKWGVIGSKHVLFDSIYQSTTIPADVLLGQQDVQDVDVMERIVWATGRQTTRPQDRVYCLLGLLGISMEPDYEEDVEKSFERLKITLLEVYPELKEAFEVEEGSLIRTPNGIFPSKSVNLRPQRLIDTHNLRVLEFSENDPIPPYAILSHRWIHGEEVTYQDFKRWWTRLKLGYESLPGYQKIKAACMQAREDSLRYIWVDTCCIEQGNHDDVARNIRSMYAYYQNAHICYAHLADVDSKTWQCEIEESEWFRRGWTLQELLAPRIVEFYDTEWNYIGSRHGLQEEISYATGIPLPVLSGRLPIHQVDVLERMSWAMGRKTTKLQDQAYCLLGLLGISMDPDYDEDVEESFRRLRIAFVTAYPEHTGTLGSIQGSFLSVLCQIQMQSLEKIAALLSKRRRTDTISLQMNIGLS